VETLAQAFRRAIRTLTPRFGEREARASARALLEDLLGESRPADADKAITPQQLGALNDALDRMVRHDEPLAYLSGTAHFLDMKLRVSPAVLIPRPETEELVEQVLLDWGGSGIPLKVLDMGTGSGCIALALARYGACGLKADGRAASPNAVQPAVTGLDLSAEALDVAHYNAVQHGLQVNWIEADFLAASVQDALPPFDLLVSNPPYIGWEEADSLEPRVRRFEPEQALFAPAADPLAFYRAAARFARGKVGWDRLRDAPAHAVARRGGVPVAYLETSSLRAEEACAIWREAGFTVQLLRDLAGHPRMLIAVRPVR
jgi:release factor glutamine methyltransferase